MKWKKSELAILGLLAVIVIISIVALFNIFTEYDEGNSTYDELENYVLLSDNNEMVTKTPEQNISPTQIKENETVTKTPKQDITEPAQIVENDNKDVQGTKDDNSQIVYKAQNIEVDFESLQNKNSDIIGWIYGPGTEINYPVVQGEDNNYYLTHMFDKKENKCGSIFMDCLNKSDFSNSNSILYGHHMRNGSMFASLTEYKKQSYYDTHPELVFATPDKNYKVELFTGFVTSVDSDVWHIEFDTKEEYQIWLDKMVENGMFKSEIKPKIEDHILTLATCSYEYDNARFVVMGVLREQ